MSDRPRAEVRSETVFVAWCPCGWEGHRQSAKVEAELDAERHSVFSHPAEMYPVEMHRMMYGRGRWACSCGLRTDSGPVATAHMDESLAAIIEAMP